MATKKTHLTPSANGTHPPHNLETKPPVAADKTRKRAAARGAKTPKATTPKQAAVTETAPAKAAAKTKTKKLSALDAAAKVLAETGQAPRCGNPRTMATSEARRVFGATCPGPSRCPANARS